MRVSAPQGAGLRADASAFANFPMTDFRSAYR